MTGDSTGKGRGEKGIGSGSMLKVEVPVRLAVRVVEELTFVL